MILVKHVCVSSDDAGRRLDNFLMSRLKDVPRSRIYRIIRKGEVRVNKGRIKPDYRLKTGDDVRIPPVRLVEREKPVMPPNARLDWLEGRILFEDDGLLVMNKPAGLPVHGGTGIHFGLIDALRSLRGEGVFLELAHRLDRNTSGCLVIAKTSQVLREFHQLLFDHQVNKHYTALVSGRWNKPNPFEVDLPLLKGQMQSGERMVQVDEAGKPSQTTFRLMQQFAKAALLDVVIHTGRTHQIRVHAAHSRHAVAGDEKYGDTPFNQQMHAVGLRRIFLHANEISFTLPSTGSKITMKAPLDDDLQAVITRLSDHMV
jgi:23S rRNA pseudouridine955/2504/2580 synthase